MTPAPATPETAALTCPRRRNTYLPGTIHKRLQITIVMDGYQRRCADQLRQAYLVDLRCSGYGSFSNTAAWL